MGPPTASVASQPYPSVFDHPTAVLDGYPPYIGMFVPEPERRRILCAAGAWLPSWVSCKVRQHLISR